MARTRKAIQPLRLLDYEVLVEDTSAKSDYFKITQFDGYLYGGRNAFLIAGSSYLKTGTKILIEIVNSEGTTVYSAPIPEYVEGSSRLIQIEVYNDTPIGVGKLIVLGCAESLIDGSEIPSEFKEAYNVRWTSDVVISPRTENRTKLRFSNTPSLSVEEKFYFKPAETTFSQSIQVPVEVKLEPKYLNIYPNGYTVKIIGPVSTTTYLSEYVGGKLTGSIVLNNVSASVDIPLTRIINDKLAVSDGTLIYNDNDTLILQSTASLNIEYSKLITENTSSVISFADIRLLNLATLSGEIYKIKISYKRSSDPGEFETLGEISTQTSELLFEDLNSKRVETGKFNEVPVSSYWYAATMSVSENQIKPTIPTYYYTSSLAPTYTFQSSSALLSAISATPETNNGSYINNVSYFIGTSDNNFTTLFKNTEYTLSFDALVAKKSGSITLSQNSSNLYAYLVPLSESDTQVLDENVFGQLIGKLEPIVGFDIQNFERVQFNFKPKVLVSGNFGIRFVVYGGFWSIANVSIKAAVEPMFSPDEISVVLPNTGYVNSFLTFKTEYLDVDNNSIAQTTISSPAYFTGSSEDQQNLYFDNG
jgi:virulence-associated protein VagC